MTEPPHAFLTSTRFVYQRCGYDSRLMSFLDTHRIGEGRGGCELSWSLEDGLLLLSGWYGLTCRLAAFPDGTWRGRWLLGEQMPILLSPLGHAFAGPALVSLSFCANHQKSWTTDRSGRIASHLHYNMLSEALWHWGRCGLPVLVAATAWSTVESNDHERRLAEQATATTRFVVDGSDTPHQDGAWWCIKAALEHAALNEK